MDYEPGIACTKWNCQQQTYITFYLQVKITPHVAGISKPKHVAEQFKENYELFINNKPIPTTVNLATEY